MGNCGCSNNSSKKVAAKQTTTKRASTSTPTKSAEGIRRIIRRPVR